jgi:hypothetical protein
MRLVVALLSVLALAFAAPAAADRPMEFPIFDVFQDINPCTGNVTTVTFVGTIFVHEHGSREVNIARRTITTSDGFVGHGSDTFVDNDRIIVFRSDDMLANASGDRVRVQDVFVLDLSTDTVRFESHELECLGPG